MNGLPYIPLDEELSLNLAIFTKILNLLGKNRQGKLMIDIDKARFFMYLVKNPSKIEKVMILAGKNAPVIDVSEIHTIKSMSINVDILFSQDKIKAILLKMSILGLLKANKVDGITFFDLSDLGVLFAKSLDDDYYNKISSYIEGISSLRSMSTSKLHKILNKLFTGKE